MTSCSMLTRLSFPRAGVPPAGSSTGLGQEARPGHGCGAMSSSTERGRHKRWPPLHLRLRGSAGARLSSCMYEHPTRAYQSPGQTARPAARAWPVIGWRRGEGVLRRAVSRSAAHNWGNDWTPGTPHPAIVGPRLGLKGAANRPGGRSVPSGSPISSLQGALPPLSLVVTN